MGAESCFHQHPSLAAQKLSNAAERQQWNKLGTKRQELKKEKNKRKYKLIEFGSQKNLIPSSHRKTLLQNVCRAGTWVLNY